MINRLKIIQHNVRHWTTNRHALTNAYIQVDADIILINSHGNIDTDNIKIQHYTVYQSNIINEIHSGTAIAVKTQ